MAEVADVTLGAKYQAELVEEMQKVYKETLDFYLEAINQDGYLLGTEPPGTANEELQAAWPQAQQMIARAQAGEPLNQREQDFLIRVFDLARRRNGEQEAG